MTSLQFDFLIVGQGLAGSILATQLLNTGYAVMVIDNNHAGSASQVAAGLINPITGHRLNMTEHFDLYLDSAAHFYRDFEAQTQCRVHHALQQIRRIKHPGQLDYFNRRLTQTDYQAVLQPLDASPFIGDPHSCSYVKRTSMVDTRKLLSVCRDLLVSHDAYRSARFDYAALHTTPTGVRYQDLCAKRIVFCEGYQARQNPWLRDLPFKLAKGDILTVELARPLAHMLSWGSWLIPQPDTPNRARLGATYEWHQLSLAADPTIAEKLLDNLLTHTGLSASLVTHDVGIRPTTHQRRPFIGPIRALNNAYCFNGFGSKGCLTIPYYATRLCDHLLNNRPLPKETTQWL